jgi:hypothetical protein
MAGGLVTVKAKHPDQGTGTLNVHLHERNADHPGGEALVYGDQEVEVAKTPKVEALLESGVLVEVKAKAAPKEPKTDAAG